MSADLRLLMRSLAEDAPGMDNRIALADGTYAAGRRRRRVRQLEIAAAATVVVLCALFTTLFVGSRPLAAEYGTSSSTHVSGYPRHIGQQFPVLDLPAKPGPIAGVLIGREATWAVSASGHRWRIPGDTGGSWYPTAVSPDGRMIAYLAGASSDLVIHDLVTGTITRVPDIGYDGSSSGAKYQLTPQAAGVRFSSDDRYLAFDSIYSSTDHSGSVVIVDIAAGKVVSALTGSRYVGGWSGDRVVTYSGPVFLKTIAGAVANQTPIRPTKPLTESSEPNGRALAVTSDGKQFVLFSGGDANLPVLSRFDLLTGRQVGPQAVVPPATMFCGFAAASNIAYNHVDSASRAVSVVTVSADGSHRTATTIDTALDPDCGVWASGAYDGDPRGPLLLDRTSGWLMASWTWLAWAAGAVAAAALTRYVRRRRAPMRAARNGLYPQFAKRPWSRRRKRLTVLIFLGLVASVLAVLTPLVIVPLRSDSLRSSGAAVWWSPLDAEHAVLAAMEGEPVSQIPIRSGQVQGYALRIVNPSSRTQRVLGVVEDDSYGIAASPVTLTMSATDGDQEHARSLRFGSLAAVPAHQARWLRVLWTSTGCFQADGGSSSPVLGLRVRIGAVTREETIELEPALGVRGPSQPEPAGSTTLCAGTELPAPEPSSSRAVP